MRVTSLQLTNIRAIEVAEFRFQQGLNLIVGVNGVGKTTMLDALRVSLSAFVKHANRLRTPVQSFVADDIRMGADALSIECDAQIAASEHRYLVHKPREAIAPRSGKTGMPREQVYVTPQWAEFVDGAPVPVTGQEPEGRPLAVFFSTKRAVPSERSPGRSVASGGTAAAFADAFANRELRLGEFAAWMRVQAALESERAMASRALAAIEGAVSRFLPGYAHLRVEGDERPSLLIDHGRSTLPVRQLSDGERGMLAMVLDLTRRLSQANPEMSDPAAEAEAVVLIDEIDLHLHPTWQRQIVHNLTAAFPRCQFIATTHSPQVIGEVEHDRIQIIADGQVYSPTHSFGVDSSRVLEEIMDADPRAHEVKSLLLHVSQELGKQRYESARGILTQLVERLGEGDPEVARIKTLLDFMEGEK